MTYDINDNLLQLKNYLKDWKQKALLNGQTSICFGGVIVYTNDLPDNVNSLCKIFADDKFLFSEAIDWKHSEIAPNKDLKLISYWAY